MRIAFDPIVAAGPLRPLAAVDPHAEPRGARASCVQAATGWLGRRPPLTRRKLY
jgi:hypothetical protein